VSERSAWAVVAADCATVERVVGMGGSGEGERLGLTVLSEDAEEVFEAEVGAGGAALDVFAAEEVEVAVAARGVLRTKADGAGVEEKVR